MVYVWFFVALAEAVVIAILLHGGAIDQAKAASSLDDAAKSTEDAIKAGIDKLRGK